MTLQPPVIRQSSARRVSVAAATVMAVNVANAPTVKQRANELRAGQIILARKLLLKIQCQIKLQTK